MPLREGNDWKVLLSSLAQSCHLHGMGVRKGRTPNGVRLPQEFLSPNCKVEGRGSGARIGRNQVLGVALWEMGNGASFLISCSVNLWDGKEQ